MPQADAIDLRGFVVDWTSLDRLPAHFERIDEQLRSGRRSTDANEAAGWCGEESLCAALLQFGGLLTTFVEQSIVQCYTDVGRIAATKVAYQQAEQEAAQAMQEAAGHARLHPYGMAP